MSQNEKKRKVLFGFRLVMYPKCLSENLLINLKKLNLGSLFRDLSDSYK